MTEKVIYKKTIRQIVQ